MNQRMDPLSWMFNGHHALAHSVLHKDLARLTVELTREQAI